MSCIFGCVLQCQLHAPWPCQWCSHQAQAKCHWWRHHQRVNHYSRLTQHLPVSPLSTSLPNPTLRSSTAHWAECSLTSKFTYIVKCVIYWYGILLLIVMCTWDLNASMKLLGGIFHVCIRFIHKVLNWVCVMSKSGLLFLVMTVCIINF